MLKKSRFMRDFIKKRKDKKDLNIKFNNILKQSNISLSDDYMNRISDCGTFLEFISDEEYQNFKLSGANFCGNRFCPHCSFNKARKDAIEFDVLIKYIKEKYNYSFLFLTLTAPNVKGDFLDNEIRDYYKSIKRLFELKRVKNISKGYIRKLEVTYNSDKDTYHPHYHILIAVNKSYFTDTKSYLSRNEWLELWQNSKRDSSITQLDIRKVKENELFNSVLEISKYVSKDSNYLFSKEVFEVFYNSLKGKQYYTFTGVFKDSHKLYKDNKLNYLKEVDEIEYIYKIYYIWKNSNYNLKNILKLSEEEFERYNNNFVEEDVNVL